MNDRVDYFLFQAFSTPNTQTPVLQISKVRLTLKKGRLWSGAVPDVFKIITVFIIKCL